ncbi:cache domain-containing protein [Clostridiaceae bacterium 35-E11]
MQNIPHKFILWLIILFIVVVSLISVFFFDNSRIILKNQYISSFDESIQQLNHSVAEFFSTFESALEMFSQNEMVQKVSDDPKQYYFPTMELFKSFQQSYSATAFAYFAPNKVIFKNKKLVTWPDTSETLANTNWIAQERPWYINAVKSQGTIAWTKPYLDATTKKPIITISKTVTNAQHIFKGVMAIDFFLDDLSNKVENFKAFKQGYAFIIGKDQRKYFFVSKDIQNQQFDKILTSDWIHHIFQRESGRLYMKSDFTNYYVTYTTNPITGWKVLGIIEEEKIYKKTRSMMQEIFVSSLIIMIIGIISIAYISKQMTSSMKDLSNSLNDNQVQSDVLAYSHDDLSNQFDTLLLANKDYEDLIDESSSYMGLLFASEQAIEKVLNILHHKSFHHHSADMISELVYSVDKLIHLRNQLDKGPSKLHKIQKENIENHLFLVYEKINQENTSTLKEICRIIEKEILTKNKKQ